MEYQFKEIVETLKSQLEREKMTTRFIINCSFIKKI